MSSSKSQQVDLSFIAGGQVDCLIKTYINQPLLIKLPLEKQQFVIGTGNLLFAETGNKKTLKCFCQATSAYLELTSKGCQEANQSRLRINLKFIADYHAQEKYNQLLKRLVEQYHLKAPVTVRVRERNSYPVIVINVPHNDIEEYHCLLPSSFEDIKIEINSVIS
jgi:hypothetical protein